MAWYIEDEVEENENKAILAYERGDREAAEEYLREYMFDDWLKLLEVICEKGDFKLVEKYFEKITDKEIQTDVIKMAAKKGRMRFVDDYFIDLNTADRQEILEDAVKKGYYDFVKRNLSDLTPELKGEFIKLAYKKGNFQYVKDHILLVDRAIQNDILAMEAETGRRKLKKIVDEDYNKIKIGAFQQIGGYDCRDHMCHGSQTDYSGKCLLQKGDKIYLCSYTKTDIETSDGTGFSLSGCGYDSVYELLDDHGIRVDSDDEDLYIHYMSVEVDGLINENGILGDEYSCYEDLDIDGNMQDVGLTITRRIYEDENDYDSTYDEVEEEVSTGNIPYGNVDGKIYKIDGKTIIEAYGKKFNLEELYKSRYYTPEQIAEVINPTKKEVEDIAKEIIKEQNKELEKDLYSKEED